MFYKDSDCSYQSKYCCLPPINVNVTCESTGGDGANCCCSKVSMREALNYLISAPIFPFISLNTLLFVGIKKFNNSGVAIQSVSNDLVHVIPTNNISLCSIFEVSFTASNATALENAIKLNSLYNADTITVPDDPCCCKQEIINSLIAARKSGTTVTIDTDSVDSSNASGKIIGVSSDIVWLRANSPDTRFFIISICAIGAIK